MTDPPIGAYYCAVRNGRTVRIVRYVEAHERARWGCTPGTRVVIENTKTGHKTKITLSYLSEEYARISDEEYARMQEDQHG